MPAFSELPSLYKNSLSYYIDLLNIIGLNIFDESKDFSTRYRRLAIFLITFLPFSLSQFALISDIHAENFLESVRVVPICFLISIDLVKIYIAVFKREQLRDLLLDIGELWPIVLDDSEEKASLVKDWMRKIKTPGNLFLRFGYGNLTTFELQPLSLVFYNLAQTGSLLYFLPFRAWWNIDSLPVYICTYIFQITGSAPCIIFLYLPFDSLMVTMTAQVSFLLRLLQVDLINAVNLKDRDNNTRKDIHLSDNESYEKIKNIVKVHQKLLSFADRLNEVFGIIIFSHVAVASLIICFFGFLSVVFGGFAEKCPSVLTMITGIVTIFILTQAGQHLCDTSSQVADAAYQSLWYESDTRVKKLMLTIIVRGQRPSYLSALGFMDLTLNSFSRIMSSSWTYFSLLIQMYGDI